MSADHLPTFFDPETCTKKGLCPVTVIRGQDDNVFESHSLYYELHGSGTDHKVVLIMGLNAPCFAWAPQVRHFGRSETHSVLVFDNRGVGNSGYPRGPYSTSGMAEDVIALLDYVGWTGERDIHIVGISLGGMIAQEVAYRIPERIASLVLAVTTPGGRPWNNLSPRKGTLGLMKLTFTPDPAQRIPVSLDLMFPASWLDAKDDDDPKGRTNREVQSEELLSRAAITLPQAFIGSISQMAAALTHHCQPERLGHISRSIPKVVILTGDDDNLVSSHHSYELKVAMPQAEFVQWKETGHGIHVQRAREFNELLERVFSEGA